MSGRNIFFAITLVCGICNVVGCSDKESPIVEKKFTKMELNAYTVDAFRFRVNLNNEVVTDSLLTPEGRVQKDFFFDEYSQRIKVYNTSDESLLIDTPYTLSVGKNSVFTIYQTQADTPPFYLAPPPGEPKAAPGKSKLSFICSGENLIEDSVKLVVEIPDNNSKYQPTDSVVIKKDNFSRYFEIVIEKSSRVRLNRVSDNRQLGNYTYGNNTLTADFAIFRLQYQGTSSLISEQLY